MLKPVYFQVTKGDAHKAIVREEDVEFFKGMGATEEEVPFRYKEDKAGVKSLETVWWPAPNVHGNYKAIVSTRDIGFYEDLGAVRYFEDLKPYKAPVEKKGK